MEKQSLSSSGKNINLIPTEMAVPARAVKLAKTISKISIIGSVVLFLSILVFGSYFTYLTLENKKVAENVERLKESVVELSQNEQKLILAKDRLSKINVVKKVDSSNQHLENYRAFLNDILSIGSFQITEANLSTKGIELNLIVNDSTSLSTILKALEAINGYDRVVVSSLTFNQGSGFIANLLFELD